MNVQWGVLKFKGDAQKCYDEIQTLGDEYTTAEVLELARNPETELHKCFDWDDSSAAEKWRLKQARDVCRSFVVQIETSKTKETTYRLVQHDSELKVYRPITLTVRNEDRYAQLLGQAKQELASFKNRYKSITELETVIEEIDRVLNQ